MINWNCYVCGKPAGKSELGYLLLMHPEHQAGSLAWAKWYRKERDAGKRQTKIADALLEVAESKMVKPNNVGLLKMQENNRLRIESQKANRS